MFEYLSNLTWADWWSAIQGVAIIATAIIAWWQIGSLKRQQKGWKTLEVCERYESDPVLDAALKALRKARNGDGLAAEP